jgi:putative phosphoserine phosphatase/1-acylglycerol-3-phosphate O-acyltransferase
MNPLTRPVVTAVVGDPVELKYRSPDADTKRIMSAISALLPAEAREPYEPTDEELMKTFPPGYTGDPYAESTRRPGTDT